MPVNCPICNRMFGQPNQVTRHLKSSNSCRNRFEHLEIRKAERLSSPNEEHGENNTPHE